MTATEHPPTPQPGRAGPGALVKLALVLGSVVLALALCEVALRIRWSPGRALWWQGGETWWQWTWLQHRRSPKKDKELADVNPLVTFSPTLGWRPVANFRDGEFRLNSRGERGGKEHPYAKPPDERRIVVVGDSYTFGVRYSPDVPRIADDEVYTALIERGLPGVSLINLGVPGYGTDQQLLRLREEGLAYTPDLVIVAVHVDNPRRALFAFRDYAKPWFELQNGQLALRGVPVPAPEVTEKDLNPQPPRLYLLALLKNQTEQWREKSAPLGKIEVDQINEAIFDAMHDEVRQKGARLLVVAIPYDRFGEEWDRSEKFLDDWGRRKGVPVLLLRHTFSALKPEERARVAVDHWTPFGHRVAGEAILAKIREEQLLDTAAGPAKQN
jgi:hypothetical protein